MSSQVLPLPVKNIHSVSLEHSYTSNTYINLSTISIFQLLTAFILLVGDQLFVKLQIQQPEIYQLIRKNKLVTGAIVYFLGYFLKSLITNTGAFEIYINGNLVSSALKYNKIMLPQTLAKQIKNFTLSSP